MLSCVVCVFSCAVCVSLLGEQLRLVALVLRLARRVLLRGLHALLIERGLFHGETVQPLLVELGIALTEG